MRRMKKTDTIDERAAELAMAVFNYGGLRIGHGPKRKPLGGVSEMELLGWDLACVGARGWLPSESSWTTELEEREYWAGYLAACIVYHDPVAEFIHDEGPEPEVELCECGAPAATEEEAQAAYEAGKAAGRGDVMTRADHESKLDQDQGP